MKRAGSKIYMYYGLIEVLKRQQSELYEMVHKALEILSDKRTTLLDHDVPLSWIPYNVISVDRDRDKVSLLWYKDFWTSERPELLYAISVDIARTDVRIVFKPMSSTRWPWNYIHRKELFIEGLEVLLADPYGNGLTLAWNSNKRSDEWRPLPWKVIISEGVVDSNGDLKLNVGKEFAGKAAIAFVKVKNVIS